jgi:hypothetical protein
MQRSHDMPERARLLVRQPAASPHARRMAIFRLPLPRLPPRKNKSRRRIFRQRRASNLKFFRDPRLTRSRPWAFVVADLKIGHYKKFT